MNIVKGILVLALTMGIATAAIAQDGGMRVGAAAIQGQEQGQGQSQSQGHAVSGSGNSSVKDSGNVSFKDSFNGAEPIRYLPVPTHVNVSTQGGPQIFGSPNYADRGPHFMSMIVLVNALNDIDLDEVESNDTGDIEMVQQMLNAGNGVEDVTETDVKFFLNTDGDVKTTIPGFKTISVNTLKAKDDNTINSASLAVRLAEAATAVGATKVVLVSEGTSKKLTSWGVGIGLSYNYASVGSKASDNGSVGAGGTGWSMGEAEYLSLPYLTAILGN